MCQLTLINMPNVYSRLLLHNQLVINSKVQHKDGTGFFQPGAKIFKTKEAASGYAELANVIKKHIRTTNPIIGHVRLTTFKTNVKDENSHPFETKKLVLAHNGTLTLKDLTTKASYGDVIDSEMFLSELDKRYNGTNIVDALNSAMSLFTGPFAFLIYSKLEDKFFAVRGETKKLHYSKVKIGTDIGFVINTESDDLGNNLEGITKLLKLIDVKLTYEEPVLILENTVNEVNISKNSIVKIGEIKENKPYVAPVTTTTTTSYGRVGALANAELMDKIYKFILDADLTLPAFDNLLTHMFGRGLAYFCEEDYEVFADYYIPEFMKHFTAEKAKEYTALCVNARDFNPIAVSNKFGLQFPFFLSTFESIRSASNDAADVLLHIESSGG